MKGQIKSLLIAAAVTSLLAGLLLTLVQQLQIIPILEQAEQIEAQRHHDHDETEHEHIWMPQQGMERHAFTALSNVLLALGFTLILAAAVQLTRRKLDWRQGLLWGLAGYAVFFLAPAFGMTPDLPGMDSADLEQRQLWWMMTSACTGLALALLVFKRSWMFRLAGLMVLALPHLIGAPQQSADANIPMDLLQAFLIASLIVNALFWLFLGGFYGYFHNKLVHQ